ncbi:MAG TPA: hypothetical protein VFP68_18790, partial [Burkholderiaceae bacterium]|nr:hypothetical protein [Burkholderiaceae bacterium]
MNQKRQTLTNVQKTSDDIGVHWTRRFFNPVTGQPDNTGSAGLEKAGWARLFYPSLDQICSGPNGQLNPNVVDNFLSNLKQYHDEGRKVLFNFNAYRLDRSVASAIHQPSGYAYDSAEYLTWVRDRLAELIPKIPKGHLQAIECANEPPPDNDMQWLAGLSRVFYVQFKKLYSPDVVVCSPAFQGGSWQQFYKWLTANADQVAVQDQPKNDGSLGERWMDVIAWHPYGTLDKMSLAMVQDHRLASDIAMGAMAGIRMAMEPRLQISSTSVWAGKPMPPIWATEFNISGVTDTLTDDDFRFQLLSQAQRASALRYLLLCAFAAGFDKAFVYAVDHFRYYPPVLASADAGTQGRVRIRLSAGRAFSGDTLTVSGAPSNSGLVGSRTGAPTLGSGGFSIAFAMVLSPAAIVTFPAPASSNATGGFPAL